MKIFKIFSYIVYITYSILMLYCNKSTLLWPFSFFRVTFINLPIFRKVVNFFLQNLWKGAISVLFVDWFVPFFVEFSTIFFNYKQVTKGLPIGSEKIFLQKERFYSPRKSAIQVRGIYWLIERRCINARDSLIENQKVNSTYFIKTD